MAYSRAVVTAVGYNDNLHPKAIGECVYRASRLADGENEIYIDDRLKNLWPKSDDGILSFSFVRNIGNLKAYKINRKK